MTSGYVQKPNRTTLDFFAHIDAKEGFAAGQVRIFRVYIFGADGCYDNRPVGILQSVFKIPEISLMGGTRFVASNPHCGIGSFQGTSNLFCRLS